MPTHTIFRLKNHALLMALAAAYPLVSYGAGRVDFATGAVSAVNAAGVQRPLTKGAEIGTGDTIRTGDGGRAQLRFDDGGMISLQPQTEFRIDNYNHSQKPEEEKGFFSLIKGGMRTITGLIGKRNRDAYKVTTSVATIGIRGTEYTASFGNGQLHVNTGEGLIEVCNGAGCMLLASGQSGIVAGSSTQPKRTESRPQLPPSQPVVATTDKAVFSVSETVTSTGTLAPVSPALPSGSANYVAWSGAKGSTPSLGLETSGTNAQFDSTSVLTAFSDSSGAQYQSGSVAGAFSMDGVIGWGRWSSGTYASSTALKDFHYVVGVPTPTADLTALAGTTATYQLAGFTTPTTSTGLTGGSPTATFTATFGGTGSLSLNLSVPVAGTTYTETMSGSYGGASINLNSASSSANGFFAGSNASHAAMTYKMDTGSMMIMGALGFKR